MKPIQTLVRAKLDAQAGQEDAADLWDEIWAAYEKGGLEGAEAFLVALDGDDDDGDDADEESAEGGDA